MRSCGFTGLAVLLGLALTAGGATESGEEADRLSAAGVRSLEVEGSYFAVEIRGRAGSGLEARFEIPQRLRARGVRILHEQSGAELRVWVKSPPGVLPGPKTPRLIFEVPAATRVGVRNSSGSVSVSGLDCERVTLKLSSGSCRVESVSAALEVTSSSGSQAIEGCDGGKTLHASSGSIAIRRGQGDIRAVTSSGSQTYAGIRGSIAAEATSGSISVTDQEGTLALRASSGSLSGRGVMLSGDSRLETSSGSIDFDFGNDLEELSFELTSTSGMIRVGDTRARGTVVHGDGPIRLRAVSTSGSQSYR